MPDNRSDRDEADDKLDDDRLREEADRIAQARAKERSSQMGDEEIWSGFTPWLLFYHPLLIIFFLLLTILMQSLINSGATRT